MSDEVVVAAPAVTAETPVATPAEVSVIGSAVPAEAVKDGQEQGAQATPATPEGDQPEVTPEQAAKREGRRFERRLDKAYKRAAEAQARAEFLEQQIKQLQAPREPITDGDLTLEKFEFDAEKYAAAREARAAKQAIQQYEAQRQQQSLIERQKSIVANWEKKVAKVDSKYEDFDEVVGEMSPVSHIHVAIMDAENGEDIAYFLGKNIAEAKRIASLDPVSQIREVGKLSAKLAAEPPKAKTPSKAPAPISPVGGKSGAANEMPSDNDDINTWMQKERARMKKLATGT